VTPNNDVGTSHGLPAQIFPADNWWNLNISSAPLEPGSSTFMEDWMTDGQNIGWFRFFGDNFGFPIVTIGGGTPQVSSGEVQWVDITQVYYGAESDYSGNSSAWYKGKFPIPTEAISNPGWSETVGYSLDSLPPLGTDRHFLVFDVDSKYLYEAYNPFYNNTSQTVQYGGTEDVAPYTWRVGAIAVWDTTTNNYRTNGWTSTDAAGLQLVPGMARYDEVASGNPITHAHRCAIRHGRNTVPASRWPATHYAGRWSDLYPPTGVRLRLKASYDTSSYSAEAQRLMQSFKDYGLIIVDYGTSTGGFEVTGTADVRWGAWDQGLCGELRTIGFTMLKTDWEMIEWGWGAPDGWTDPP
jgi:hypothetical protein